MSNINISGETSDYYDDYSTLQHPQNNTYVVKSNQLQYSVVGDASLNKSTDVSRDIHPTFIETKVEEISLVPSPEVPLWKALAAEFIGTFALVFIGAGTAALTLQQGGSLINVAFAFGIVLMTMIYVLGSYSGANFNPAVSFGLAISGRMNWGVMLAYWIVQLVAGIAAAALILYFLPGSNVGASIGSLTYTEQWKAVLAEAVATFFLVITVLIVTHNPMFAVIAGVAIGLVLTFDILAIGPLTGGSMNPARSLGPALFSGNMSSYWIYVVGPLLGGLLAAFVYKLFTHDFGCCNVVDDCGNKIKDDCGRVIKRCERQMVDNCGKPVKFGKCGEPVNKFPCQT